MLVTCPQCRFSRELPEDKIPARAQVATCPKCKHKFRFRDLPPEEAETAPAAPAEDVPTAEAPETPPPAAPAEDDIWERLGSIQPEQAEPQPGQTPDDPFAADPERPEVDVPFERLDQFGFFPGITQTIRRAMFSPQLFFQAMPQRGLGKPLTFAVLLGQFQIFFQLLWSMTGLLGEKPEVAPGTMGFGLVMALVLAPLFLSVFLFLETAVFHFCLILFRSANKGFEGTFRVMAYSNAPWSSPSFPSPARSWPISGGWGSRSSARGTCTAPASGAYSGPSPCSWSSWAASWASCTTRPRPFHRRENERPDLPPRMAAQALARLADLAQTREGGPPAQDSRPDP
jgi:Uncharacterized protein conserved in archaea